MRPSGILDTDSLIEVAVTEPNLNDLAHFAERDSAHDPHGTSLFPKAICLSNRGPLGH